MKLELDDGDRLVIVHRFNRNSIMVIEGRNDSIVNNMGSDRLEE